MAYVVVYDACVLHDPAVRDLLVRCAGKRQLNLQARWSEAILDEVVRTIVRRRPDLDERRLQRTRSLLNEAIPDCLVTGYEPLIEAVRLPDPNDRHVVACALKAQAQTIVTSNLKDFPADSLRPHGLDAVHPDEFVRGLIDLNAPLVAATLQELVGDLRRPPSTTAEAIERLPGQTARAAWQNEAMRVTRTLWVTVALLIGFVATPFSAAASVAHYRYDHRYALNNLRASPGAAFKVGLVAICRRGYAESARDVTEAERTRVYAEYGITHRASGQYEIDHLIPLELGGNNSIKNLWPEPNDHPRGYLNSKDKLENRLHALVCARRVSLVVAQRTIAKDWVAAYHRFLGAWPHGTVVAPPKTTRPTTTLPATARVTIMSIPTRIAPGSMASLTAHSPRAHDACRLTVVLPSGRTSTEAGLGPATANAQGVVSWTWRIDGNTGGGTATASVACGAGDAERSFTIL